ncbi:MAG TPA: hypothetical protein VGM73_14745 [Candidatus Didemnitutus sp.]|jgi:hypothetical protein
MNTPQADSSPEFLPPIRQKGIDHRRSGLAFLDQLPRYAGIDEVSRPGLPVDECARMVARLAALKRGCVSIYSSRMPDTPEWELKAALARWMWEDATHFKALEDRLTELRSNKFEVGKVLSYQLGDLLTEVLHSPGSLELCTGLLDVIGPALIRALEWYVAETQPLVDFPTVRILKTILAEERERQVLGQRFLDAFASVPGGGQVRAEWRAHFEQFLHHAGGVLGRDPVPSADRRPVPRAVERYQVTHEFARDKRFTAAIPKRLPEKLGGDEKLRQMMWVRSQEMCAAETVAVILAEWDDLPSEAVVDLARHCWDETRHSLMGQAALEQEGIALPDLESWVGFGIHALAESPQKALAHLSLAIEAGTMAHPGGKRGEWEFCRDVARHPLMTTFQDFDWSDEVTHVKYGRKWLIEHHFKGNREAARKMADDSVRERVAFYARYGTRDWMAGPKEGEGAAKEAQSGY